MSKNQYIYAVARTRVLETRLLTNAFIEQLISTADVEQCRRLLSEKGWDDDLDKEEKKIFDTVRDLRVPTEVFDVLMFPVMYHNLKAGIKQSVSREENARAFFENDSCGREKMLRILADKDYAALPAHMRTVAKEAYEAYLHTQDGQLCDVMVDKACLEAIGEAGKISGEKVIRDYAAAMVEVSDVKIALRCAATGKSEDFTYRALARCRAVNTAELSRAAAGGTERVMEYLHGTSLAEAADAYETSPSTFEKWCDNRMIEAIKSQKRESFSIGPIFAYVIARQNEVRTVRIILTGKANGLSEDEIRERAREMYG